MATASAPASSANLGPGFDVLALAMELRCTVTAVPDAQWSVSHVGPHYPGGDFDSVLDAAQRAVGPAFPLRLTVDNHIPIARGLGSSAAAAAAGATAAWRATGEEPSDRRVFELVARMEEHPDNAAASVCGGLVLCTPDGEIHRLPVHPGLIPLLAIPAATLATSQARAVLTADLPRDLTVRSLGRLSSLVAGLLLGDDVLLGGARGDEMHEAPRNHLRPEVGNLIDLARTAGAAHSCWSGAGPAVLALVRPEKVDKVRSALEAGLGEGEVLALQVAASGLI